MTTTEISEIFAEEIAFLQDLTAYENGLVPFQNKAEASETISKWLEDGIEVPCQLQSSSNLMLLWNTFITPDQETARRINRESYIERMKVEHPEWLFFDYYYEDGETLVIDPDQLMSDLKQAHYDIDHRSLIVLALRNYLKTYNENL